MNRGIARRVVFPEVIHIRMFLALLACAVRRGEIEVHVFCVMPTHYHLLVRSPSGKLSEAMRRVQNDYVRWYNRRTRRDGSLFRGRFRSRPVLTECYHDILVRYIEGNPVQARIVERPEDYPYGSAARHARGRVPRWLATGWVDDCLARARLCDPSATYISLWGRGGTRGELLLVESRLRRGRVVRDDLDDLVGAAPERVQRWMGAKALLADGGGPREPLVDAASVDRVVAQAHRRAGDWDLIPPRGPALDLWAVARVGLLTDLAGLRHSEIAELLGVTTSQVGRLRTRHHGLLSQAIYAERLGALGAECLRAAHGPPQRASPRDPDANPGEGCV